MIFLRQAFGLAVSLFLANSGTAARAPDPPLEFFGFRAGASLGELAGQLRELGASPLRCKRAKVDRRVRECRAVLSDPDFGTPIDLWVSAIDSAAGILTLSGSVAGDQLDRWRRHLQARYGQVDAKVQGTQWMMQWVRRGRMLRLTWRIHSGERIASVSLVDGTVLDAWGQRRTKEP